MLFLIISLNIKQMWAQTELSKPFISDHSSKNSVHISNLPSEFEIWNVLFLKNDNSRKVTDQKILEYKLPSSIFL